MSEPRVDSQPFVSVVIPVYDSVEALRACLQALETQTYPRERYEVLVVDNGSEPPIDAAIGDFSHATFHREPRRGVSRARVTGIEQARGEILAFTDADCIPDPDWIEKGVERLVRTPACGMVAGRIQLFYGDPAHPNVAEVYSAAMHMKQERFLDQGHWAVLANAFTFRRVVDAVPMNAELFSSGETEWGERVYAAGYAQVYAPEACVRHPARNSIRQLCARAMRLESSWSQLRCLDPAKRGVRRWLGQYMLQPVLATHQDIIRSTSLRPMQKIRATALSVALIQFRIAVFLLVRAGMTVDPRKHWG